MLRGAGRNRARPRGAPGGAAAADPAGRPYRVRAGIHPRPSPLPLDATTTGGALTIVCGNC
jgi:hypothetical protein